jgi:hypothetical protein
LTAAAAGAPGLAPTGATVPVAAETVRREADALAGALGRVLGLILVLCGLVVGGRIVYRRFQNNQPLFDLAAPATTTARNAATTTAAPAAIVVTAPPPSAAGTAPPSARPPAPPA